MASLKKLIFAPIFLISFSFLLFQLKSNLGSYDIIFSLSIDTFKSLLIFSSLICLSSFLFCIFAGLAGDLKIVLPINLLASILPPLIIDPSLGLIISFGTFIILALTFFTLSKKLKSYINFEPAALFGPSIRSLVGLLILVFSIGYFMSINKVIAEKGFQIPESLIDSVLKFTPTDNSSENASLSSLSSDQIALLKQNPALLKQSGLDPKILDSLTPGKSAKATGQDIVKQTLQAQVQTMIKPYINFVPAGLAVFFFIILQSLTSLIGLLIYPLLWITFFILEKTGYIKFTEEQRTVRKILV